MATKPPTRSNFIMAQDCQPVYIIQEMDSKVLAELTCFAPAKEIVRGIDPIVIRLFIHTFPGWLLLRNAAM